MKKIIKRTLAILLLIIVLIIISLSIPAVQTVIAKKVTTKLNKDFGTSIFIDRLGLNWKGEVDIREVYIEDHHQDTLIYAKRLQTNLLSVKNLLDGNLDFGFIELNYAKFYFKNYKGEESDNVSIFADKFNTGKPKSDKVFTMFANDIKLTDSKVKIINENLNTPEIFNLSDITIKSQNLLISGPNVSTGIKLLSVKAKRGFEIKSLSGDFYYTLTSLKLEHLNLKTGDSNIKGNILMSYDEGGMADFVNKVNLDVQLEDSRVSTNDLNAFYNEFGKNQLIEIEGKISGTLNKFSFTEGHIKNGGLNVHGDFIFTDLLKGSDAFIIEAENHDIRANYSSLARFMPRVLGDVLPKQISYLGNLKFKGNSTITKTTLISSSVLSSSLGNAKTTISIENLNDIEKASYVGDLLFSGFDLGKLTNSQSFGVITANLHIEGVGFTQQSLDTEITGVINSFVFEEYDYKNITLSGNLKHPIFDGELIIDDPNLRMDFTGLVDVSEELNKFDFKADIDFAELNQLNLVKRDSISVFAGKVLMKMNGNDLDNTFGTISFNETFYQNENDFFYFDDFVINSKKDGIKRTIEIVSPDIMTGNISGEFKIKEIPKLFLNGIGSIYANYIPKEISEDQYINYDFQIYNKLIEVFIPEIQFGENTRIKGTVSSKDSKFKFDFESPEMIAYKNYLGKVKFQVDNNNPLYNAFISVDTLYNGFYNLKDINLINKTLNDTLYVGTSFKGGKNGENEFNLSLYHTIDPEGNSVVGVKKSEIIYKENIWYLNEKNDRYNKIIFDNKFKNIQFDSIVLSHNEELIQFAGSTSDSLSNKNLKVHFQDVNIGNLVPKVDSLRLYGKLDGDLKIIQKNGDYFPSSNLDIVDININDVEFGDLNIDIEGNNNLTKYNLNASLINKNVKSIDAVGFIDATNNETQINLDVELNDFNLKAISPFGGSVITDIRGLISGAGKVMGALKSPDINGNFTLKNGGLKVPYLNIDFDLDETSEIAVTKNKIEIGKTIITDTKYNTKGVFYGYASHHNFSDWKLNLNISTDNLLVLDTPPAENQLYYGTAFIEGTAEIYGPIDELVIDVVASTQKNTVFKIPLSDTESIDDNSFIKFLSPKEKEARLRGETIVSNDLKGLSLNFDLDINSNAEVEIVIDQVNKSALRGRGAGTLFIEINTLGKFNMWGDFIVYEGIYDFRYGKIIRKEIEVERDGTITWDGVASKAMLNLKAIYKTNANPSSLLDDPTINRKIPVEVFIDLTNEITQPELKFDIGFPEVSSIVRSELEYKLQTDEEREKQALFLLTTDSFISTSAGQSALSGTVTDGINAILAQILSDEDAIINIAPYYDMGVDTAEIETRDEIGVQFSSQISNRIVINGKVGIPVGGIYDSRVAGDVDVQWLVNKDGSLRINIFNRQAELQFIGEDQTFEQGAGVSYSIDFDDFKELVDIVSGKAKKERVSDSTNVKKDEGPVTFKSKSDNN
ncbi:MAG: translocation/assembly module TamB domain-containing protein [Flavobacteriaceae bacterium]